MTAPIWQSRTLIVLAILATIAIEGACMAYNWQSASRSQVISTWFGPIQTDVWLKTLMSAAAGASVVIGAVVAAHQWRKRHIKGRMAIAVISIAVALCGYFISTGNLSGYFAWVREQRAVEVAQQNPLYDVAAAKARRIVNGENLYLTGAEQRALNAGQPLATATRDPGDISRAAFMLALVAGMATGFRLPEKGAQMQLNFGAKPEEKPAQKRARKRKRRDEQGEFTLH